MDRFPTGILAGPLAGRGRLEQLSIRHLSLFQLGQFCGETPNVIVPVVFLKTDLQKVGQLAQLVLKDPSDLLCQHLPAIVAKILPRLSEAKLQRADVPVTLNRFAQTKYQEIQQVLMDRNRISLALKNGLLELLTRLLFTVHDFNVSGQLFGPETVLYRILPL